MYCITDETIIDDITPKDSNTIIPFTCDHGPEDDIRKQIIEIDRKNKRMKIDGKWIHYGKI